MSVTAEDVQETQFSIPPDEHTPIRCDRYVSDVVGLLTRSQLKSRVVELRVNGKQVKLSHQVTAGDKVVVRYTVSHPRELHPAPLPFTILFENRDVLVINKPRGIVVHIGDGNERATLVDGIVHARPEIAKAFPDDSVRPGIVHRLDKDTSGALVVAKHQEAKEQLVRAFAEKEVEKHYLAIVKGTMARRTGTISGGIQRDPHNRKRFRLTEKEGKASETAYRVVRAFRGYTFVELRPKTGRTHQLRVHLSARHYPVLGDPLYSRKDPRFPDAEMMLHAYRLRMCLPGDFSVREFTAPIPQHLRAMLATLLTEYSR